MKGLPTEDEPGTDDFAKSIPDPRPPVLTNVTYVLEVTLDDLAAGGWYSGYADAIRVHIGDQHLTGRESYTLAALVSHTPQLQLVGGNPGVLKFEAERLREAAQREYQAALLHQQTNTEPF